MARLLLPALAAAALFTGCTGGPDVPACTGAQAVKLSDLQASVFTPSCATSRCHSGDLPAQDLTLEAGKTFAATVNKGSTLETGKRIVKPGDPANSTLYTQVHSGKMPKEGAPLTSAQVTQIHDWICSGAPND